MLAISSDQEELSSIFLQQSRSYLEPSVYDFLTKQLGEYKGNLLCETTHLREPAQHEAFLYHFLFKSCNSSLESDFHLLSDDERRRFSEYRNGTKKYRYVSARANLRRIIGAILGITPKEVVFHYQYNGKPVLHEKWGDITFSVSYSENRYVIAISKKHAIGVDVQALSPRKKDVFNTYFVNEMKTAKSKEEVLWPRIEAIGKMHGLGLSMGLKKLFVLANECEAELDHFFDFKLTKDVFGSLFLKNNLL